MKTAGTKPPARAPLAVALVLLVCATRVEPTRARPATVRASARAAQTDEAARADVARFRSRVDAALSSVNAAQGYWGVLVSDADSGQVLYALNADRYFTPASNAKLFTTAMALATLGAEFRIRTTIETTGIVNSAGQLQGDLVLVGRGDANLSNRVFPYNKDAERSGPAGKILGQMADQVVAHGVKEITGDVIGDDSYFGLARFPPGWTVDDTVWSYGAAVSAIAVNDNVLTIRVRPGGAEGAPLQIDIDPATRLYEVHNTAVTTAARSEPQLRLARDPDSLVFYLSGSLPLDAPMRPLAIGVTQPAESAADLLESLLEARGVKVDGHARARHADNFAAMQPVVPVNGGPVKNDNSAASPGAVPVVVLQTVEPKVLAEHISPSLLEDVRLTNKISQNLHAELLLRLAAKESANAMTLDDAVKFASQFRQGIGIAPDGAMLSDGSGLSRNDLVTPRSVATLLTYARRQPWGSDFQATLPVAGEDGTLENRMKGTAEAGRIQAKSGTFDHVDSLSGYATSLRGERLVFSIFGNNIGVHPHDAAAVIDAMCAAIVEELGAQPVRDGSARPR